MPRVLFLRVFFGRRPSVHRSTHCFSTTVGACTPHSFIRLPVRSNFHQMSSFLSGQMEQNCFRSDGTLFFDLMAGINFSIWREQLFDLTGFFYIFEIKRQQYFKAISFMSLIDILSLILNSFADNACKKKLCITNELPYLSRPRSSNIVHISPNRSRPRPAVDLSSNAFDKIVARIVVRIRRPVELRSRDYLQLTERLTVTTSADLSRTWSCQTLGILYRLRETQISVGAHF